MTGRDQLWRFLYPWGSSSERIVFRSSHNKWLVSENGKDEIKNNRVVIGSWEKFRIVFNDDGTVSIKTWQNEYFSAKSNGKLEADQSSVGSSEKFEMFIYKDEKVALRTFYRKWVTAPSTSALQANKDSLGSREQFRGWKEGSIKSWRAVNLKNSQSKFIFLFKSHYLTLSFSLSKIASGCLSSPFENVFRHKCWLNKSQDHVKK